MILIYVKYQASGRLKLKTKKNSGLLFHFSWFFVTLAFFDPEDWQQKFINRALALGGNLSFWAGDRPVVSVAGKMRDNSFSDDELQ